MSSSVLGGIFKLNDGHSIPLVGLGTYQLFSQNQADTAVSAALECGYRLFDTAKFYGNERELGTAFEKLLPNYGLTREDIFIETKANISGSNAAASTTKMIEHSLSALKSSYLDVVLIHYPKNWGESDDNPKNRTDRSDAYGVLAKFQKEGKIRSIGVSNFEDRHIDQLVEDGHPLPAVNQCEFHPHLARPSLLEYCRQKGIFFQAHTSLAKHAKSLYTDETLVKLADKYSVTVEQALLAFAHCQDVGVIPKSENPERIKSNLNFLDVNFTEEEISSLNKLDKFKRYSDCDGWNVA